MRKVFVLFTLFSFFLTAFSQTNPAIQRFLTPSYMKGASVSICVRETATGNIVYSYDADREVTPASVMKIVSTSAAIEILGENFRFETAVMYDGNIEDGVLNGNLYIRGSGDPSIGSNISGNDKQAVFREWLSAVKQAGIKKISGAVVADESIFDTEGVSMKWMREDLGSYYGQGCYGLNIFDNLYSLVLKSGDAGSRPEIIATKPDMKGITFHNYLTAGKVKSDSIYITGFPYSNERYLYGVVPANRANLVFEGDIPEPALYLSGYFTEMLNSEHITVSGKPTCYRILSQEGRWNPQERKLLTTTYSKSLRELIKITNRVSSNLYADAFLKTVGLKYQTSETTLSSFEKGVRMVQKHWTEKGIDVSSLWMHDGSGLASTDRLTANILCRILAHMQAKSAYSVAFVESIPKAGIEGTVLNMLKSTKLQGVTRLKSGTMSRVRSYAGYITKDDRQYAVAILVNNFSCRQSQIKMDVEQLLLALF